MKENSPASIMNPMAWLTLFPMVVVVCSCGEKMFPLDAIDAGNEDGSTTDLICSGTFGTTYYVRLDGGDAQQCTGLENLPYPGDGVDRPCALSHPFFVFPPGDEPLLAPGDRLVIASGNYPIGVGAPGASSNGPCESGPSKYCYMPPIPSGVDARHPTCVVGEGWDGNCSEPSATLSGVGGVDRIVDLTDAAHVRLECLELADSFDCIHDGPPELNCRDAQDDPVGDYAVFGIDGSNSVSITLRNMYIHGMAADGIVAFGVADWLLENVRTLRNGWNGIVLEFNSSQSQVERNRLIHVTSSWNGCSEDPDTQSSFGCRSEDGYGLSARWEEGGLMIEDSEFAYNTRSGLGIVQDDEGGELVISRVKAFGNAEHQLDLMGSSTVSNCIFVDECDLWFDSLLGPCREMGGTVRLGISVGTEISIVNSSLFGRGESLLSVYPEHMDCNSGTIRSYNNIFVGEEMISTPGFPILFDDTECSDFELEHGKNIVFGVDPSSVYGCPGYNNICQDPAFNGWPDNGQLDLTLTAGSPAVDTGLPVGTHGLIPNIDYDGQPRPSGHGVDCGAFERQ